VKGVNMAEEHMLTTVDNPWNPFTHYNEWHSWDTTNGYYTASYLARIAKVSIDFSEADLERSIEDAIQEIVASNPTGIYVMTTRSGTKQN
jgi:hypothetical protein